MATVAVCLFGSFLRKVAVVFFCDWCSKQTMMVNTRPVKQRSYRYIAALPT